MPIHELIALASQLLDTGQVEAAIALYRDWLQRNPDSPHRHAAGFNLGVILASVGQDAAAMLAYQQALLAGSLQAGMNLALLTEQYGDTAAAIALWQTLLDVFSPADTTLQCELFNQLGRVLETSGQVSEAEAAFTRSLAIEPEQPVVQQHRLYLRQRQCRWPLTADPQPLEQLRATSLGQMQGLLALVDDPEHQVAVLRHWLRLNGMTETRLVLPPGQPHHGERLRLGYLLDDEDSDAAAWLRAARNRHDAARYEVWVFLRQQATQSTEDSISLDGLSDQDAAGVIHRHQIDILIDLDGYHQGILDCRPAALQLGIPGLHCWADHPAMDYVLVDPYLWAHSSNLPAAKRRDLDWLPAALHPELVATANPRPLRQTVVFCHAGDAWRITESLFQGWMDVLNQVPDSVLWLAVDAVALPSLQAVAVAHGVAASRIQRMSALPAPQLAEAAVFLDTYPASAGRNSQEALRQGVPVLTWAGEAPASRLAGSALTRLGLTELITTTRDAYIATAVQLGTDPERLAVIRAYLASRLRHGTQYDLPGQLSHLQDLYTSLWQQSTGTAPAPPTRSCRPAVDPLPFFSVVVVHYEGSVSRQEAVRCLQSLYHQKYQNFEILLLHDGPRTLAWETDEFPPPPGIRIKTYSTPERANDYGHSVRDAGIRMARGQYVLITNADNYHYTNMLLEVYLEIIRPYPTVVIHDIDRTAADIIIFGILAKGYLSLGTHENLIDFREFNMDMAARQWLYLSGYPAIMKNIDCMQFVMRRELWLREGGWSIRFAQAADGLLFQAFVKKYGVRYIVGPLAEHL